MMLITLEYAKLHCRVDNSADDLDITAKIRAASRAVVGYMIQPPFGDSSGEPITDSAGIAIDVPDDVQIATAILVAEFYRNRDGDQGGIIGGAASFDQGYAYLPRPVVALLYRYRTPTAV